MADSEITFAVEESPEGDYEAHAPGHSIYSQADTLDEIEEMVRDAVRCHFDETDRPRVIRLHYPLHKEHRVETPERHPH